MKTKEDCSRCSAKLKINTKSLHTFSHINFHIKFRILIAGISLDALMSCCVAFRNCLSHLVVWWNSQTAKAFRRLVFCRWQLQWKAIYLSLRLCLTLYEVYLCFGGFTLKVQMNFREPPTKPKAIRRKWLHNFKPQTPVVFARSQQFIQGKSLYDRFTGDLRANKLLDFQLNFLSLAHSLASTSIHSPVSPPSSCYSLILAGFVSVYFFVLL